MAILSKSGFYDALESVKATGEKVYNRLGAIVPQFASTFVSGFAGKGWAIRNTSAVENEEKWTAEFDNLVVRGTMNVFELLISRIRAVNGGLVISQANAKVASVKKWRDALYVYFDLTIADKVCEFMAGDYVRMQVFRKGGARFYHLKIERIDQPMDADHYVLHIKATLMEMAERGMSDPQAGDEIVQYGNASDPNRQSAIYLHADGMSKSAIDLVDGIGSQKYGKDGHITLRVGGDIPNTSQWEERQPNGFFCENGTIVSQDDSGKKVYEFKPDGSGQIAREAIKWQADGNVTLGGNVKISWENFDSTDLAQITPQVEYSFDGTKWDEDYAGGETWMRVGFPPSDWSVMRLSQSGDSAYIYIRYGYQKEVGVKPDGTPFYQIIFIPLNPTEEDMKRATHIGVMTSASPTPPAESTDKVSNYTWSEYKGKDGKDGTNGKDGKDANLLPWVEDWNGATTQIGSDAVVSPRMFIGSAQSDPEGTTYMNGIAIGRSLVNYEWVDGTPTIIEGWNNLKSGIVGVNDNEVRLAIDPEHGTYYFKGDIYAENGFFRGEVHATSGEFTGKVTATEGVFGNYKIGWNEAAQDYELHAESNEESIPKSVHLYSDGMVFSATERGKTISRIAVGSNVSSMASGGINQMILESQDTRPKYLLSINARGAASALHNCAINLQGGYVRGYCASLLVVDKDTEITRGVNVVVATQALTIKLPTLTDIADDGYRMSVSSQFKSTTGAGTKYAQVTINGTGLNIRIGGEISNTCELVWSATQNKWLKIG